MRRGKRRALIECHDNVRAEQCLDFHRPFRAQHMPRSIEMRFECHAFLSDFGQVTKTHDLITATIGQDRTVPFHEIVQPAKPRHALGARAKHQVVSIAEDDIGTGRAHGGGFHGLYGCRCADRHERRGADFPARHLDHTGTRCAIGCGDREIKACHGMSKLESP